MIYICKLISPLSTGISAGDIEEGKLVSLNEGGVPVQFYMAKQDYESGLNGAGRTLLVRKDVYDKRQWHGSNVNAWASCFMRSWLNSTYKNLLDADILSLIGTTKIRYTPGNGNWTVGTRSDSVFLLSLTELGQSHSYANTEGSALPIANMLKVVYLNGSATTQWTRSPNTNSTNFAYYLDTNVHYNSCTFIYGSRPCFTLPADFKFKESEVS